MDFGSGENSSLLFSTRSRQRWRVLAISWSNSGSRVCADCHEYDPFSTGSYHAKLIV